jgi:hypothetical protein
LQQRPRNQDNEGDKKEGSGGVKTLVYALHFVGLVRAREYRARDVRGPSVACAHLV